MVSVKCKYCGEYIDSRGMRMHVPYCKRQPPGKRGRKVVLKRKPSKTNEANNSSQPVLAESNPKQLYKPLEVQLTELRLTVSHIRDILMLALKNLNNIGD